MFDITSELKLSFWKVTFSKMYALYQMSAVGITENAKGDNKKFEVWCNSREEVYIVQVRGFAQTTTTDYMSPSLFYNDTEIISDSI